MKRKFSLYFKFLLSIYIVCIIFFLQACGLSGSVSGEAGSANTFDTEAVGENILHVASDFAYASLDPHMEYYGWYTSIYGITQTLFTIDDDYSIEPLLASSYSISDDNLTFTINIRDDVCFSNGEPLTADMVVRNLERLCEKNTRYSYMEDFSYEVTGDYTFSITTSDIYPTMINDLASPEAAIIDLDNTTDFDSAIIGTGPFVIKSFEAEGTVEVSRNENYWDGDVVLDGAVFYYMQDASSKMMAMQSGEIDVETSTTSAELSVYEADPDTYSITSVSTSRLQFYINNMNTMDEALRKAINLTIDAEEIADYLGGTTTATDGPFASSALYGAAQKESVDTTKAIQVLEAAGYVQNTDGYFEKDGEEIDLNICYYNARSLDTCAIIMQEELDAIGIKSHLSVYEDPDATYISSGDFDIALYCMIADKNADPYYFLNATLRDGSYYDVGGFDSDECEELLDELETETDTEQRAVLANRIVRIAIDSYGFGYIGHFNKITVTRDGANSFSENLPFDFYGLTKDTTL